MVFSINSIGEGIKVFFDTIKSWIGILENFFLVFRYNWASVTNPAARFKNIVALHLYQEVTLWNERGPGGFGLHFVRDRQKNEVDFLISKEREPFLLVETKLGKTEPAPVLLKMKKLLQVPAVQLYPGLLYVLNTEK